MATTEQIAGSVARVEDTLILNRGSEHGVEPGMIFAVLSDSGDPIIDPENRRGDRSATAREAARKGVRLHPKYSRAETFRTYTPPRIEPLTTALGRQIGSGAGMRDITDVLGADLAKRLYDDGSLGTSAVSLAPS